MKWLLNCIFLVFGYTVVLCNENKLTYTKIRKLLTENYFASVIENLPKEMGDNFDLANDVVIEAGITMEEYLKEQDYTYESHTVTTKDGYILGLDRITDSPSACLNNTDKPAVLIMHGLASSSVDWVLIGPGRALPLLLSDAGYDVWLGNNRGNTWSRKHKTLDPDKDASFWEFSFHECGIYDLPALIDYILDETGEEKLSYVGHSQGCTEFLVLTSMFPEYNEKIWISALLAPPAYMGNVTQPFLQMFKYQLGLIEDASKVLGINELSQHYRVYNKLSKYLCDVPFYLPICLFPIALTNGLNFLQVDTEIMPKLLLSFPSSISNKQLWHFGQEIVSGHFRQYDYGEMENLLKYGKGEPPDYDLSKISAPIGLFYSVNDVFADSIERVSKELGNVVLIHEVEDKLFTHLDFLVAREVDTLLNVYVIEFLNLYNGLS